MAEDLLGTPDRLELAVSVPDRTATPLLLGPEEQPVVTRAGVTGNAWLSWAGEVFSIVADGAGLSIEELSGFKIPRAPLTGVLSFTATGSARATCSARTSAVTFTSSAASRT